MELHEAVRKAQESVTKQVLSAIDLDDLDSIARLTLLSYGGVVKSVILEYAEDKARRSADKLWGSKGDKEGSDLYELMTAELLSNGLSSCWVWFSVGWRFGASEIQVRGTSPEVFFDVIDKTDEEELALLAERFSGDAYLKERFKDKVNAAGELVSALFAAQRADLNLDTATRWFLISTALPLFEAYEVGMRTRILLEEEVVLDQIKQELD